MRTAALRALSQASAPVSSDGDDDFTPVLMRGWPVEAVDAALAAGYVFFVDTDTAQAIAVPMDAACRVLANSGAADSIPWLRSRARPVVKVNRRTKNVTVGNLHEPIPMSKGGDA